jgi:hypothetical protein
MTMNRAVRRHEAAPIVGVVVCLAVGAGVAPLWAVDPPLVEMDQVACVPAGGNGLIWASVSNSWPETSVRLFFRRLNDVVEDLYFVEMQPAGDGRYWGVMPRAEKRKLNRHELAGQRTEAQRRYAEAAWWRSKEGSDHRNPNQDLSDEAIRERASVGKAESRDWMMSFEEAEFDQWLRRQEFEPVEYFGAVVDANGNQISRSPMMVGEVWAASNCPIELTPEQAGEAANLVVGETALWQAGKPVFHWMCAGVVARVDPGGVKRADGACRQCVPCFDQQTVLDYTVGGAVSPSE